MVSAEELLRGRGEKGGWEGEGELGNRIFTAKPLTAAIIGLRIVVISCQFSKNLFWYTSATGWTQMNLAPMALCVSVYSQDLSFISFMSAPAVYSHHARERPVPPPKSSPSVSVSRRGGDCSRTGKSLLRASDDNGADLPVCVDQTQCLSQFCEQCGVERVERLWAVERHECDAGLRARREYVLIVFVEGGHEPDGSKGELV